MELELVAWLRRELPPSAGVLIGPGDDAAVLDWQGRDDLVVTVDMVMDGVDFHLDQVGPEAAGRKALAVNLSDLAAMGAQPVAAVVALALPRRNGLELARGLYRGLLPLAAEFGVSIVGGDTNAWDAPLAVSITLWGSTPGGRPWLRSGARPGDRLFVTGPLGGSILGHHLDFTPRVTEALALRRAIDVHAAIDISDGLALDLARLCQESGCGAELRAERIPLTEAAHTLAAREARGETHPAVSSGSALDHALGDGEDFELLLALPEEAAENLGRDPVAGVALVEIGVCLAEPGLWLVEERGARRPLAPRGFVH